MYQIRTVTAEYEYVYYYYCYYFIAYTLTYNSELVGTVARSHHMLWFNALFPNIFGPVWVNVVSK